MNGDLKASSFIKPKINPKELSNEELEFIIRTGKMPPSIQGKENQQPYWPASAQHNMSEQALLEMSKDGSSLRWTNPNHNQLTQYLTHSQAA